MWTNYIHWQDCSAVIGIILQHWLARLFNSHWHDCSTVTGMLVQQSLARMFNSRWQNCSTVAGTIVQQSLAWLFNSHWHNSSTVNGTIAQQSLAHASRWLWQLTYFAWGTKCCNLHRSPDILPLIVFVPSKPLNLIWLMSMPFSRSTLQMIWHNASAPLLPTTSTTLKNSFLTWLQSEST